MYVGRAEAASVCIQKEKELAKLEEEKILRRMAPGQIFSRLERDLETAIEEMENSPTADLANQAREHMAQVARVAKSSDHLQGSYVRLLNQAAVMGAATAEVLRTRADRGENDSEISRQLKAIRKELADVKREAIAAREEADLLRKELAERERGRRISRSRAIVDDSPPPTPERGSAGRKAYEAEDTDEPPGMVEVPPMETELASEAPPPERRGFMTMPRGRRKFSLRGRNGYRRSVQPCGVRSRSWRTARLLAKPCCWGICRQLA